MIYEPKDYEQVIERIKGKISAKGIKMGAPLSEEQIAEFENNHGIKLPEAYRMFLKSAGNGCEDMLFGCTLKRLEDIEAEKVSEPFMLEEFWVWEDDERDESDILAELNKKVYRGNIELIDMGDGMCYNLIVTGKCRGEVWNFADVGVQPCCERQDFLGWFELWLDNGDETDYFSVYSLQ